MLQSIRKGIKKNFLLKKYTYNLDETTLTYLTVFGMDASPI